MAISKQTKQSNTYYINYNDVVIIRYWLKYAINFEFVFLHFTCDTISLKLQYLYSTIILLYYLQDNVSIKTNIDEYFQLKLQEANEVTAKELFIEYFLNQRFIIIIGSISFLRIYSFLECCLILIVSIFNYYPADLESRVG